MKVTPESIQVSIENGMPCVHVSVTGDGRHFESIIVSSEFAGKNRIQRHQRVYLVLGDRMRDEIHALSMKTLTPDEWETASPR
ncbi:MAG: BolA family protein [Gallionellaceae bacterium]|jgi:acid stress-induced BolA-like protein IbaG/YrbA